jgi:hypothetical protein
VVIVDVIVVEDCTAGFGASCCFWHPANANAAATIAMVMIAKIFFMILHLLSSYVSNSSALVSIEMNWAKNAQPE